MTWFYRQSTGELKHDNNSIAFGYSGFGADKNKPESENNKGSGPIPRGRWLIGPVRDSKNTGPYSIVLNPAPGTDTLGRGDFRIHGDSIAAPGSASHGCIIMPRVVRQAIMASKDNVLEVIE